MNLLNRITSQLATRRKRTAIARELNRLSDRGLADLGLERLEIGAVARLAGEVGPEGASLSEVVGRAREHPVTTISRADRLFAAFERMSARKLEAMAYVPDDFDRYVEEAHRLRAEAAASLWRSCRRGLARQFRLGLAWGGSFGRAHGGLAGLRHAEG